MKAIRLEEPKHFEHVDIPEPDAPGPGQVLVRTHRMGICGTDYSGYLGKMPFFRYPRIPAPIASRKEPRITRHVKRRLSQAHSKSSSSWCPVD